MSDQCMFELMGGTDNNYKKCAMSNKCLDVLLKRGNEEYTLTHQLLYTILAEQVKDTQRWGEERRGGQ